MKAEYGRPVCGMPALAETIMFFTALGIQVFFSLVAQLALHGREQINSASE